MKKVETNSTVTVHYTGRLEDGTIFDSSMVDGREPLIATLGEGQLIKGFENGLLDMLVGDKRTVEIESTDAYGEYSDHMIQEVEKSQMPGEVEVGTTLQAQTQMISLQKQVSQAKAQLAKTLIRAPFSGTIDEVFVERGQVVSASPQGLMRIVNLNNMFVSTSVPETYIGKLKVGTEVDVFLTSLGKTYKGKVRQVGNYINPNNRSFGIEVGVPNPDNLLRPNQVAKLKIIDYTSKQAIVVPTNVVLQDGEDNKFVFVVSNSNGKTGIAKKVLVKVGKSSDNVTEIVSGLSANDVIVTEGVNSIADGMKLNF
jgi:RND family efflux transporter MFP subunit